MSDGLGWVLALGVGLLVSWIAYPSRSAARLRPALMALRAVAVTLLLLLLLDVAMGVARPAAPLVALDVSGSWMRSGSDAAWRAARDSVASAGPDAAAVVLFGDSLRSADAPTTPSDRASAVGPVLQRASASGQRVVIVTDGALDDPDALQQAVAGSRVVVVPVPTVADRAVESVSVPAEARVGDTVTLAARITADGATGAPTVLRWMLGDATLGEVPVPALAAGGEAAVERRAVIPAGDSTAILRAILAEGDAQPRNDTVSVAFRRGARQRVVVVSTAPDADVRDVATALRSNVALPTDVFYRIAPGRWLRDGTMTPVDEATVRTAARGATLAVLHGDTAVIGPPGSLGTRALLLLAPPVGEAPELLVRPAPSSPLQAALGGIVLESLPPLMASTAARGGVTALSAAPNITTSGATPVVSVMDGEVRRVLVTAAGYSRWRSRGGVSEVAFQALIGGATDWLLGARGRATVATPALILQREGAPLRWRRGARPTAVVALVRDGDRASRRDTVRFGDAAEATTPPVSAGTWRGTVDGTAIVLPISPSREWLPVRATVRSGPLNGVAVPVRRGARSFSWLYLASVLLLAAEWLLRRKAGLR